MNDIPETRDEQAKIFKAFCDPNRLRILELLKKGEQCTCYLQKVIPVTQPTLSHHLKILTDSGLVNSRKDGRWVHFSLNTAAAQAALRLLERYISDTDAVCCATERLGDSVPADSGDCGCNH
ncbi:MAG: metalloregulator ArsR/SmtB family transcription factor [Treponema sp.]|jgi:ArsR family transcriptional regulator|nr:metalloregulator ArsR/SmtB family transcription factor [Treponema sp.]